MVRIDLFVIILLGICDDIYNFFVHDHSAESLKEHGAMMLILVSIYVIVLTCHGAIKSYEATSMRNSFPNSISLEGVLSGQYLANHMTATWMSDNELMYKDENVNVE